MFCDTVYRFRCDETKIYPKYLELALNSPAVVAEIDRRKSGISDSGISLNHPKIKTLPIPLVGTITAQKNVVDEIGLKLEKITTLEMEVSQSLLKADALRQSILKKAFSGQLVPQDPNDEPASVLLERIRAERAAQPKVRGRKAGISA
jgi:type I restriction enzyme S subunit